VIKGFIVGLALTIIVGQVPKLLGIDKHPGDFFEQARGVLSELGDVDGLTVAVGVLSLAAVLALRRFVPVVPGSLLVVLVSIAAVTVLGLDDHGLEIVGNIPAGLPSIGWPDVSAHDFGTLAPGAIGVMLVGFAEGLGAAKTYAARHTTTSTPTASCWASAPRTSAPA
jgi:SulP family sulfate permease